MLFFPPYIVWKAKETVLREEGNFKNDLKAINQCRRRSDLCFSRFDYSPYSHHFSNVNQACREWLKAVSALRERL